MSDLRKALSSLRFGGGVRFDEPLDQHTTYRVGGPADAFLSPISADDVAEVMRLSRHIPVFILGAGANILVSDRGIRGIVLDMGNLSSNRFNDTTLTAGAGLGMSEAARLALGRGLAGLEFIYAMPGSVGGSVWMNARCYERSVSDVLAYVEIVDQTGTSRRITPSPKEFAYKISPFQRQHWAIVAAGFTLHPGNPVEIERTMLEHDEDRRRKGHFSSPSAGSVFKNNREFGAPSGKIIDTLGLRGTSIGGAKISELHANIITNTGKATACEILQLIEMVEKVVEESMGFCLEREVRLAGDWSTGE